MKSLQMLVQRVWASLSLLLLLLLPSATRALCPNGCSCDDSTLVVSCVGTKYDVVPITLNPSVQRLILKLNRIRSVEASFQFYGELRFVDLSYNHLVSIPQNSFEAQKKLNELHLNNNKISSITNSTFNGLNQLTILNLRENFLEELGPRQFHHLTSLEELDLGKNRLSKLHVDCFAGLSKLRVLYVDDNQLMAVPKASLMQLSSLAELRVGLNAFNILPDDIFQGLSKLANLDVSGSNLTNISDNAFQGLTTLRSLNLANNGFKTIPTRSLAKLTRLEDLKIGQNPFESIQIGDFAGLNNLRSLEIRGAPNLEKVERGKLSEGRNLESISFISNEKLSEIGDRALMGLPKLKTLVLKNNAFTTFSDSMVNWSELRRVDVSMNPLVCTCQLLWLHDLLRSREESTTTIVIDPEISVRGSTTPSHHPASPVTCAAPNNLKGKSFRAISAEDLGCATSDSKTQAALIVCMVILLLVVLAVLAVTLRFRRRVRDALKDPPRWFPSRSASGAAIARKEHEYQKAQLGCGDDDYMIRAAAVSAANTVHGCGHGLKPIPVTEL